MSEQIIEHGGFKYFKKGAEWYQISSFFTDSYKIEDNIVPDIVKTKWDELMFEQEIQNNNQSTQVEQDRNSSSQPRDDYINENNVNEALEDSTNELMSMNVHSSISCSANNKFIKKKKFKTPPIDPRLTRERSVQKAASSVNFAAAASSAIETVDKSGNTPIVVTDSIQLIRPLRAELRCKMKDNAKELEKRMEIRKNIMNVQDERLYPFEPKKKNSEYSLSNRIEDRKKLVVGAEQIVSKLARIKDKRKLLEEQIEGDEEENPIAKIPTKGNFFPIEQLAEVAAANNVVVLNYDKFVCATDKRRIIYNDKGICIFCDVHGNRNFMGRHLNERDCPYFFCTCANCYYVGKLGEQGRFIEHK